MFYLSRAEQVALLMLVAVLLAGVGVLTFARGQRSAESSAAQPIFVPAPARSAPLPLAAAPAERAPLPVTVEEPPAIRPSSLPSAGRRTRTEPEPRAAASAGAPQTAGGRISLNTATQQEIDRLPGIGPVFAQRIIAYREQRKKAGHDGFESKDELLNVPGIGPKRYAAIRDLVTL